MEQYQSKHCVLLLLYKRIMNTFNLIVFIIPQVHICDKHLSIVISGVKTTPASKW